MFCASAASDLLTAGVAVSDFVSSLLSSARILEKLSLSEATSFVVFSSVGCSTGAGPGSGSVTGVLAIDDSDKYPPRGNAYISASCGHSTLCCW